jgi:hypothetical protein
MMAQDKGSGSSALRRSLSRTALKSSLTLFLLVEPDPLSQQSCPS